MDKLKEIEDTIHSLSKKIHEQKSSLTTISMNASAALEVGKYMLSNNNISKEYLNIIVDKLKEIIDEVQA